jgi:predicted TIM-barrel fold metal-dependent hydrolase
MITRRKFLQLGSATAAALLARYGWAGEPPTLLPAQPRVRVGFDMPAGACDTHVHVVGAAARYPYVAKRAYTPPEAGVDDLRALHRTLHIDRVVVVQPSFYGTDNSCTMDAVRSLGSGARAIVVIDEKTPEADLDAMQRDGARGVRLNLATAGISDPAASARFLKSAVARIAPRGWHVQLNTEPKLIAALKQDFAALPATMVFDHFGGADAARGVNDPGFDALVELVKSGKAYVKISATNLFSTEPPHFAGYAAMAQALIAANPDRILWGSNWPHPGSRPPGHDIAQLLPWRDIDDAVVLNLLPLWAPDAAVRKKILVDNPARLFGF